MKPLPSLSREQLRSIDIAAADEFLMPTICLMENAGRGAAEEIANLPSLGTVTILCGKGNNGGDGFVIARHLQLLNREVRVWLLAHPDDLSGDASTNHRVALASGISIDTMPKFDQARFENETATSAIIVDAMLGTGSTGNPREPFSSAIIAANHLHATRVAIDIPSGMDCDTGCIFNPCFRADITLTFVASKIGFESDKARQFLGTVKTLSIGAPLKLLQRYTRP